MAITASVARGRDARIRALAVFATFLIVATALLAYSASRPATAMAAEGLTVSFTAAPKPYDDGTAAVISDCVIDSGIVGDDNVTCEATGAGTFADASAGNHAVTADPEDFTLGGDDAAGYEITSVEPTTATIHALDVTVEFAVQNKPYDGDTHADFDDCTVLGVLPDDDVTCDTSGATAAFQDKNVGTGKTVDGSGFDLDGVDASNYDLTNGDSVSTTADIEARDLTPTATGIDRGYDGTDLAEVTFTDDRVEGDDIDYDYDATFEDRNAGTGKAIEVTGIEISGADAGNYALTTTTASASADVAPEALTITAVANVKEADGGDSADAIPQVTDGTIFSPDTPDFSETYATTAAGSGKTLEAAGKVIDGNDGKNYTYSFVDSTEGRIYPAPADSLEFTAQPIDTEANTPIYHICVPSGGSAPCALAGPSGSTPVEVTAKDTHGNLAGPGAPGDEGEAAPINVTIRHDTGSGTVLGSAFTDGGVAEFGDQLTIATLGASNKLHATAADGSSPTTLSSNFAIVTDLAACDGQKCNNNSTSNSGLKLQKAAGQITTGSDFFNASTNVLLSTRYTAGGADTNLTPSACGSGATIGDSVDFQVTGTNVAGTSPNSALVFVMPKDALKAYNITARGADTFEICLGALKVAPGPDTWTAKNPTSKKLQLQESKSGPESRQWGLVANCGTAGLDALDPCMGLRTKQAATARSYLLGIGWTADEINAIGLKDADIILIVRKSSPWDGKMGLK